MSRDNYDAVVVGGGFYGCSIATHLRQAWGLAHVAVVEREPRLLARASYNNQARIHGGYHYPRDFTTAYRSRANFAPFAARYRQAVDGSFTKLYAVARRGSLVNAQQFQRGMAAIGAPCVPASRRHAALFSPALVEAVFQTEEYAFNATVLAEMLERDMAEAGVEVLLGTTAHVAGRAPAEVVLDLASAGPPRQVSARVVVNCTYAGLAHLTGGPGLAADLKYQVAELCMVEPPEPLRGLGVTLMDGPFFSCMPFPARGLYSLSHVRHTPQLSWSGRANPERNPYDILASHDWPSAFAAMRDDAARYMPTLAGLRHQGSLFEVKVVLAANAKDDGRPILVEGALQPGGIVSILGGKLDNISDVLAVLDSGGRTL